MERLCVEAGFRKQLSFIALFPCDYSAFPRYHGSDYSRPQAK